MTWTPVEEEKEDTDEEDAHSEEQQVAEITDLQVNENNFVKVPLGGTRMTSMSEQDNYHRRIMSQRRGSLPETSLPFYTNGYIF